MQNDSVEWLGRHFNVSSFVDKTVNLFLHQELGVCNVRSIMEGAVSRIRIILFGSGSGPPDKILLSLRMSCIDLIQELHDTYSHDPNLPMSAPPPIVGTSRLGTDMIETGGFSPFIDKHIFEDSILRGIHTIRQIMTENTNRETLLLPMLKGFCSGLKFILRKPFLVGVLGDYTAYIWSRLYARNPVLCDVMTYEEVQWSRIWSNEVRPEPPSTHRSKIGLEELFSPFTAGKVEGHIVEMLENDEVVRYVPIRNGEASKYSIWYRGQVIQYHVDTCSEGTSARTPTMHIWRNLSSEGMRNRDYFIHRKGSVDSVADVVDFTVFRGDPVYMIHTKLKGDNINQYLLIGGKQTKLDESKKHAALATCGDRLYVLGYDENNWWIFEYRTSAENILRLEATYSTWKLGLNVDMHQFLVMNLRGQKICLVHSGDELFAGTMIFQNYRPDFTRIWTYKSNQDLHNVSCIGAHTRTDGVVDIAIYKHIQSSERRNNSDTVVWMRGTVGPSSGTGTDIYNISETRNIDSIPCMYVSDNTSDHPFTQMHRSVLRVENDWAQQIRIGHGSAITSVSATPDMSFLASVSGGQDNSVRVWRRDQPHCVAGHSHHKLPITRVFITPDGKKVISGTKADDTEPVSDDDEESGKDHTPPTEKGKSNIELGVLHVGPSDADADKAGPCITIDQVIDDNWVTCIHSDYDGSRIVFGTQRGEVKLLTGGNILTVYTAPERLPIECVQVGRACVLTFGHRYDSSKRGYVSSVYYNTQDITTCADSVEEEFKYAPLTNINTICIHEDTDQNIITLYAGTMDGTLVILRVSESQGSLSVRLKSRFSSPVNVGSAISHIHWFAEEEENVQRVLIFTEKGCHVVAVNSTEASISLHSSLLCGDLPFTGPICAGINGGLVSILSAGPEGKEDRLVLRTEETCVKMVYGTDMAVRARWQDET